MLNVTSLDEYVHKILVLKKVMYIEEIMYII